MRSSVYSYRRPSFFGYFPPGIKWLIIINTGIFIFQMLFPRVLEQNLLLALYPVLVVEHFCFWQLFTYMFLHGGITHLLFNMLTLWMFGVQIERDWGMRQFLKYYILCGVGAGLCDVALNAALGHWNTSTIGASGAIFGLLMAFGVLYPNQTVLMDFLFPIKAKYLVMIYGAIELVLAFGVNNGVSNIAHLGGMAFGFVYLKGRFPRLHGPDWRGAYKQWKMQRAKRKFQVYMRKHNDRGPWVN